MQACMRKCEALVPVANLLFPDDLLSSGRSTSASMATDSDAASVAGGGSTAADPLAGAEDHAKDKGGYACLLELMP